MTNAIKYQDTKVDVEKTLSDLTNLIKRYGGTRFEQNWTPDGHVRGVRFAIHHDTLGELPVRMLARTDRIQTILLNAGLWKSYPRQEREKKVKAQAERIAWRHVRDLTEQLLLAVQLDIRSMPEAFLADVEIFDSQLGETVRMSDYLQSRAYTSSEGLVLSSSQHSPIELPAADTGQRA